MNPQDLQQLLMMYLQHGGMQGADAGMAQTPSLGIGHGLPPQNPTQGISQPPDQWPQQLPQNTPIPPPQPDPLAGIQAQLPGALQPPQSFWHRFLAGMAQSGRGQVRGGGTGVGTRNNAAPQGTPTQGGVTPMNQQQQQLQELIRRILLQGRVQ